MQKVQTFKRMEGEKKVKKINKNLQLLCLVFCNTPPPDHQQGLAWTSSSWVSFSHMTSKRANQLTRSKPNHESLCGTSHTTSTSSPRADWVTEQCSGNITKTLLNFCPPPPSPSLLLCSLLSPPSPTPPLLSQVGASWACYPNPTVVVAFVSLTRGPALYTCQGANESNKQEPGKKGGQASAVLLSLTGFLATALPWKLGNPQSASLMSDDALALMETLEKHLQREITCCLASVATRGRRHIQSVWVHSMKDLKRKYHLGTHNNWLW